MFSYLVPLADRHTGDTGIDQEHDYYDEPRHRYSLSDMITHLKRSIPDLRSIKHQPLQNKDSPSGSPRASHYRFDPERNQQGAPNHDPPYQCSTGLEKETITLSAVAIRTCSCGASKESTGDKSVPIDEMDQFPPNHRSNTELRYIQNDIKSG